MDQPIYVTSPMPRDLELRARIFAASQRISRSELVRLAVLDYLERQDEPYQQKKENNSEAKIAA